MAEESSVQKTPEAAKPQAHSFTFTDKDLWGADGRPDANDVQQKGIGDCFLIAAAGEVARQSPELIRAGISYDEKTGDFSVRLSKDGQWTQTTVTQADLKDNLSLLGGSSFTMNSKGRHGALWPAVYEVGYAKSIAGTWSDGFERIRRGGNPSDALEAITGEMPVRLDIKQVESLGAKAVAERIDRELGDGKRVLMSTRRDPWQDVKESSPFLEKLENAFDARARPGTKSDGVFGHHAYMVVGARYDEKSNETFLKLRNPWGNNERRGSAESDPNPEIEVKLNDLIRDDTRSLNNFHIAELPEQQRGLLEAIREKIGGQISEDVLTHAALLASREGISSAAEFRTASLQEDGKLWIQGNMPGFRTMIDTAAEIPPRDESMSGLVMEQKRLQQNAEVQDAPVMRQV